MIGLLRCSLVSTLNIGSGWGRSGCICQWGSWVFVVAVGWLMMKMMKMYLMMIVEFCCYFMIAKCS